MIDDHGTYFYAKFPRPLDLIGDHRADFSAKFPRPQK